MFTNHPRTVRFAWLRVPQAASYGIEIDGYGWWDRWCSDAQGMGYIVPKLTAIAAAVALHLSHLDKLRNV